jgi:hypothetical protein
MPPEGAKEMTAAERFWYVLWNIGFGAGYFAKLPIAKAIDEVDGTHLVKGWAKFWYVLENIAFGAGYLAKVIAKRALEQRDLSLRSSGASPTMPG